MPETRGFVKLNGTMQLCGNLLLGGGPVIEPERNCAAIVTAGQQRSVVTHVADTSINCV